MSVTTACAASPVRLRTTSRLKPTMTASERSITATLSATETTAMRTITPGLLPNEAEARRRAMKKGRFTTRGFMELCAK